MNASKAVGTALLALAAWGGWAGEEGVQPAAGQGANAPPGWSIFYTCDLQGRLLPITCEEPNGPLGGIGRLATLLKTWGTQRSDHVIVDVGNAVAVKHKQADAINQLLYKAFDTMGYAVINCGQNEAALSLDRLTALTKGRKAQMISANLLSEKDNKPVFPTHHVVRVGDVRIGFIGVLDPNLAPLEVGAGLRIDSPVEGLRSGLVALKGKADLVVVLACLPGDEIYKIARRLPGIDLILGGRCQASSAPYELVDRTLIAYLGDEGCTVGRLDDLTFPNAQPPHRAWPPYAFGRVGILDKVVPSDASVAPILADLQTVLGDEKAPGADWDLKMPCTSSFVGSEVCKLCHIKQFYSWQATNHAGAYATLFQQNERRREKDKGKATKGTLPLTKSPACLVCHVTGYGMPGGYEPEKQDQPVAAPATDGEGTQPKEAIKGIGPVRRYQLANVGCEVCHGGGRRHLGVAIKAKFDVTKAPQLRVRVAAHTCLRCHHGNRPCLEPGKDDPFEMEGYLTKIKHWGQ